MPAKQHLVRRYSHLTRLYAYYVRIKERYVLAHRALLLQGLRVAEDDEPPARSRQHHVEPPPVRQEAHVA